VDAGHPMGVDGDRMEADSSGAENQHGATADEDWTTFRDRMTRQWRSRRAPEPSDGDRAGPDEQPDYGSSGYSLTDFCDRLLSGPAAELFGDSAHPQDGSAFTAFQRGSAEPVSEPSMPSYPSLPPAGVPMPPPVPAEASGLVRPYFRTGGRTRPSQELAIEALVSTSERGRALGRVRVPEHRSICSLCLDTRSVAEVAAYLRLPLGVVRVLIGDVAGLGLVLVHSANVVGDRPNIDFMERVLSGLRRI
jgi:uncharacterized protein DUF742